jgi:serine/threonine protein kinase
MKISNKISMKEYDIAEKINTYIDANKQAVKSIKMVIKEGFVLSEPVGGMMTNKKIRNENYIIQILNQLAIGQKLGYVHRDIRLRNIIIHRDSDAYLIDWDSSTYHGFKGGYEGGFITASTPVLNEYEFSKGGHVSAYYADDWVSVIYMLLLSHCSNDDYKDLQSFAAESSATSVRNLRENILASGVILTNRNDLPQFMTKVILKLNQMECRRDNSMDVDELYRVTIEIITAMKSFGLVT